MSQVRANIRPVIEEFRHQKDLPPTAAADVEAVINSSPYLENLMSGVIESGSLKHLAVSSNPHEAGRYDSTAGIVHLNASNFAAENFEGVSHRLDNLAVLLGHEIGHAMLADAAREEHYRLSYEATEAVREASREGTSADLTAWADRYLVFMRRNEAFAELVGMNSLASRTTEGGEKRFSQAEFIRRADPHSPCVQNGVLLEGINLSPDGIQLNGGRLINPAVEAVAQCYADRATGLGQHGDAGYGAYYGAYVMETLYAARREYAQHTTLHVPEIELDLAALKLDPRQIERAGLDLGGQGRAFAFIDISEGRREYQSVAHTYSRPGSPDARRPVAEAVEPQAPRPSRADQPTHPDFAAFDAIRRAVRSDGRWDEEQSTNIAAALLREHKGDALSQRLDQVAIGNTSAQGDANVFAVYAPFGQQGPFFTTQVDTRSAAQTPAERSLDQVEQINRQQTLQRAQEPQVEHTQAQGGPRMSMHL